MSDGATHVTKIAPGGPSSWVATCSCGWERECWVGKIVPSNREGVPPVVVGTALEARRIVGGYAKLHRLANEPG